MAVGGERVSFRDGSSSVFHSLVMAPDPCAYGQTTGDQWDIKNKTKQDKARRRSYWKYLYLGGNLRNRKTGQTCIKYIISCDFL